MDFLILLQGERKDKQINSQPRIQNGGSKLASHSGGLRTGSGSQQLKLTEERKQATHPDAGPLGLKDRYRIRMWGGDAEALQMPLSFTLTAVCLGFLLILADLSPLWKHSAGASSMGWALHPST